MPGRHVYEPGWFGWLGWVLPLVLLVLLVAAAVAIAYSFRRPAPRVTDSDPLRRAAARYAAGEIERVEFERIQRDLAGGAKDPLQSAALRLARGEITTEEFDELRVRLTGSASTDAVKAD